jgi:hypothetical protein
MAPYPSISHLRSELDCSSVCVHSKLQGFSRLRSQAEPHPQTVAWNPADEHYIVRSACKAVISWQEEMIEKMEKNRYLALYKRYDVVCLLAYKRPLQVSG